MLEKEDFVKAIRNTDILLAPHHGREDGYYAELFEYFKRQLTIISDGRFCETSATARYSNMSTGWKVHHRKNGNKEERYSVSTRNDGMVIVKLGYSNEGSPFMYVEID